MFLPPIGAIALNKIPDGITRQHIIEAISDLGHDTPNPFGNSTGYDLLYQGRRYAPKAVLGLAASKLTGIPLGPYDFKGGLRSKCFRILTANGFTIITKGDTKPFPDEVEQTGRHTEGAVERVLVNRYERDQDARAKAIKHHGFLCQVCGFDFVTKYGTVGEGFIHVHHIVPLSTIGQSYVVDPINDLRPVCPNCHAMLHKRIPPYTIKELRDLMETCKTLPIPA